MWLLWLVVGVVDGWSLCNYHRDRKARREDADKMRWTWVCPDCGDEWQVTVPSIDSMAFADRAIPRMHEPFCRGGR